MKEALIQFLGWEDPLKNVTFPGEGNGYPLQYSGLENSMDSIIHGVTKSQTGLSNFHFHFSASLTLLKPLCGSQKLWKILKKMGIPDHLTCLLRNLYAG